MLKPFSTLKKRLSKRRVRVNSTSSLPVNPPYEPAPWILQCTGILLPYIAETGANVPSFSISQGACPSQQGSAPRAPSPLLLSIHLDPSGIITHQTWQMSCLLAGLHPRQLPRGPLVWSGERWCPYIRHWHDTAKKHLAKTPTWWGRWGRNTLGATAQASTVRTPATSWMSFDAWLKSLVYLALPSMRLKKQGQEGWVAAS